MTRSIHSSSIPRTEGGEPTGGRPTTGVCLATEKSELNRTIVTVIGSGLAGLAAAHELAERGFLVQVVEKNASTILPGEVEIGGMAASQYGRVKPAIEHLHVELIEKARHGEGEVAKQARHLLEIISYTRSPFVQTEKPIDCCLVMNFGDSRTIWRPFQQPVDESGAEAYITECVSALWNGLVERRLRLLANLTARRHKLAAKCYAHVTKQQDLDVQMKGFLDHEGYTELTNIIGSEDFESKLLEQLSITCEQNLCTDFAERALRRETLLVELRGHASRDGQPDSNFTVSLERAETLKDLIESTVGNLVGSPLYKYWNILKAHVSLVGMGEREPITDERTSAEVIINRRAEVVVVERRFPGEHGFRVFPRHYWNTFDMMRRIPVRRDSRGDGPETVLDALRPTTIQALGVPEERQSEVESKAPPGNEGNESRLHVLLLRRRPKNLEELRRAIKELFSDSGVTENDVARQQLAVSKILTMSKVRRWSELEDLSWKEYLGLGGEDSDMSLDPFGRPRYSREMTQQITSAAQSLLAYSAGEADAHSYGNFAAQVIADQLTDGSRVDRLLNGPTTEAWLLPWKRYLQAQGVRFFLGQIKGIQHRGGDELIPMWETTPIPERVKGRDGHPYLDGKSEKTGERPDFYVLALPLDRAYHVSIALQNNTSFPPNVEEDDFTALWDFYDKEASNEDDTALKWMSGLQFFYETPVSLATAHIYYPWSQWGVSAISQTTFWNNRPSQELGYLGVISVDLSDWHSPEDDSLDDLPHAKPAKGQSPLEIAGGTWAQIYEVGAPTSITWMEEVRCLLTHLKGLGLILTTLPKIERKMHFKRPSISRFWVEPGTSTSTMVMSDYNRQLPCVFHLDSGLRIEAGKVTANDTRYLAARKGAFRFRPGLRKHGEDYEEAGYPIVEPALNCGRWVLAGSYMATHTRMMTMEGSIESGRLAAARILKRRDCEGSEKYQYNGSPQASQPPRIYDIEYLEIEELSPLKRLDRRLYEAGLPHVFDILRLEERLDFMLCARELKTKQRELDLETDATALGRVFENADAQAAEDWPKVPKFGKLNTKIDSILSLLSERLGEHLGLDSSELNQIIEQLLGGSGGDEGEGEP